MRRKSSLLCSMILVMAPTVTQAGYGIGSDASGGMDPRVNYLQTQVDSLTATMKTYASISALPLADRVTPQPTTLEELVRIETYLLKKNIAICQKKIEKFNQKGIQANVPERQSIEEMLIDLRSELDIVMGLAKEMAPQKDKIPAQQSSGGDISTRTNAGVRTPQK